MSKRFTDTGKWKKLWFRKLPIKIKCFWIYLIDNCNHAGIWEVDFELASLFIGEPITETETKEYIGDRYTVLKNGRKWFISKFIDFQYGELNPVNRVHKSILYILEKEGAIKGLKRPVNGCKDKDKDKDNIILIEDNIQNTNISKDKYTTNQRLWLKNIPLEDINNIAKELNVTEDIVIQKGITIHDWAESKNKKYYNHKSLLKNCIRGDIEKGLIKTISNKDEYFV